MFMCWDSWFGSRFGRWVFSLLPYVNNQDNVRHEMQRRSAAACASSGVSADFSSGHLLIAITPFTVWTLAVIKSACETTAVQLWSPKG